jgi:flagellar basal-body rod modification protein FlgD
MTTTTTTGAANPFAGIGNPTSRTTPAANSGSTGGNAAAAINSVDFLNLMMTQLKNQDPTQPLDTSQMSAQLAQIGTVTGINQLNSSFSSLASSFTSNQALQASSLLGRSVLVNSSNATLAAGGKVSGAVQVPAGSGPVTVGIFSPAGALVKTLPLGTQGAGLASFTWDGTDNGGTSAPAGNYVVKAEAQNGQSQTTLATLVSAQVQSVTLNGGGSAGGLTLNVAGVGNVPLSSVTQIAQ